MKSQKEESKKPQQKSFEASAKSTELLLIEQKVAKCTAKDASKNVSCQETKLVDFDSQASRQAFIAKEFNFMAIDEFRQALSTLVTKDELLHLRDELSLLNKQMPQITQKDFNLFKAEIKEQKPNIKGELRAEINELKADIIDFKTDLKAEIADLKFKGICWLVGTALFSTAITISAIFVIFLFMLPR